MGDTILIETTADEVVSIVTQGPQGPSGAEAATLTTTGDLLYRAALANDRLPIGSEGQVLKVASGLPAWGNESGAVTSVNGETGAVVLDAADVGAAPATGIDPTAISGTAVVDSDARLSDSRTPTAHAASHASAGSDPLAPSDIGAQSIFTSETVDLGSGNVTLTAARAKIIGTLNFSGVTRELDLPTSNNLVGDTFIIRRASGIADVEIYRTQSVGGNLRTLAGTITVSFLSERQYVFIWNGVNWVADPIPVHTHPASEIDSGTLDIARIPTGTGSTQVALGDHTHTQLHTRSHAITSTSDHTAGNHKVFYSNGSGEIVELALGNSGEVLTSNGATSAPSFAAASGGVSAVGASAADILSVSGSDLVADDLGADKLYGWDDSAGKAIGFTIGSGLTITDDTITASGAATSQTDVFTANGTWTKPAGAKSIHYILVGGGGGGGSGRRGAASTDRYSGGGGAGAAIVYGIMDASKAGSTESVTVGAGGAGGASPADSTNGNAGTAGGESSFGTIVKAIGGNAGGGGTNSAGGAGGTSAGAGTSIFSGIANLATGATGGQINGANAAAQTTIFQPTGGGSGGGISAGNSRGAGGAGGLLGSSNVGQTAGGTAGTSSDGGNGNNSLYWAGTGGGGGQANNSVSPILGHKGGNGGIGAGGGGGSGATDADGGDNSGGAGGNGIVVITTFF